MNFLAAGWSQVRALWRGMPMGTRLAVGLLVAVAAGSLVYLRHSGDEGPGAFLLGGQEFSGSELARAEAALRSENLVNFQLEGNRIRVPAAESAAYTAALAKGDALPVTFYSAFDEVIEKRSLLSSSTDQERQWDLARQKALANVVKDMAEAEDVFVFVDRATPRGLSRESADVRAVVYVRPRFGQKLTPSMGRTIRSFVAG